MAKTTNAFDRLRAGIARIISPNAVYSGPLFNGPRSTWGTSDASKLFGLGDMSEEDKYKSYAYAVVTLKANRVATLGEENVKTRLANDPEAEYEGDPHPYLELIDNSPSFDNSYFWIALSHYLDLKGRFYVLAVRAGAEVEDSQVGDIQELQILNPYNVQRVFSSDGEFGGYREIDKGRYRDIPRRMMIEGQSFNPFNLKEGYARIDAATDAQILSRDSKEYTRKSIKNNVGQRGILTTDVILEDTDFKNFKSRVKETDAGDFLIGNGPGSLAYTDTQIDLDKLALEAVKNLSREELFAVTGGSKTMLGIEESGTTREVANVQERLLDKNHSIPTLRTIISAFNQDYRNNYPSEYQKNQVELFIDSPLKADAETELKQSQVVTQQSIAAKNLVDAGYDPQVVLEVVGIDIEVPYVGRPDKIVATAPQEGHDHDLQLNRFDHKIQTVAKGQQSTLHNAVVNWQNDLHAKVFERLRTKLSKNAVNSEDDLLTKTDQKAKESELTSILVAFQSSVVALFATQTTKERLKEFGKPTNFQMNKSVTSSIRSRAKNTAASHLDTTLQNIYSATRDLVKQGAGYSEIVSELTTRFSSDVVGHEATRLARTETQKAVTASQFEADKQFLDQNNIQNAFKEWQVQSPNPCPFCEELDGTRVPFEENFVDLGDSVEATFPSKDGDTQRHLHATFEPIENGNAHPNCSCIYALIIEED